MVTKSVVTGIIITPVTREVSFHGSLFKATTFTLELFATFGSSKIRTSQFKQDGWLIRILELKCYKFKPPQLRIRKDNIFYGILVVIHFKRVNTIMC